MKNSAVVVVDVFFVSRSIVESIFAWQGEVDNEHRCKGQRNRKQTIFFFRWFIFVSLLDVDHLIEIKVSLSFSSKKHKFNGAMLYDALTPSYWWMDLLD